MDQSSIDRVLHAVGSKGRNGLRNRCIYLLRGALRHEQISHLRIYQVLDPDGQVTKWINADGHVTELGDCTRREIATYLRNKYSLGSGAALGTLLTSNRYDSVFSSARRTYLTPTVVAQVLGDATRVANRESSK